MLDSVTKKRIDDLRNILVGKIPNPQSQVEQITTGLIYKFMYDMDVEAIEMGGVPSFFVGDYEKYSWKHLFDSKLGGANKVKLYSDAIENMYTNPSAPTLFREIFKNSFLPFKDPSTLNMFLKEINEFTYSHSEKLGDAFEYLLSFMGSQGNAGQFRTPRHIIDFIVQIVNPQKNETILDPACGTAGFLISSFKHIINQHTDKIVGDKLNAADRKQIGENLVGYDISPDMTRISLVNMYLHKFASPKIIEYDTLSSEDRWSEYYDVILANPPFFSPTGGIQPHSRFGVKSKRAEVLFVDYIVEHLKPNGRAGIVVPEGIIFQTGTAYKTLRKKLVEDCLVGVISLPAGVFQPYSGLKTSILILDKKLHQKSKNIFLAKIENDGFSLGIQRIEIHKNDIPVVLEGVKSNKTNPLVNFISKEEIASKEFLLTGGTYKSNEIKNSQFPLVPLGEFCALVNGRAYKKHELLDQGKYPVLRVGNFFTKSDWYFSDFELDEQKYCNRGDLLFAWSASFGAKIWEGGKTIFHYHIWKLVLDNSRVNKIYLKYLMDFMTASFKETGGRGGIMMHLTKSGMEKHEIPLPPIADQQKIVEELNSYQIIIDGCNQIVENYKPTIDIEPSWEQTKLKDICTIVRGSSPRPKSDPKYYGGSVPRLMVADLTRDGVYVTPTIDSLTELGASKSRAMKKGEVVIAVSGNPGLPCILNTNCCIHDGFVGCRDLSPNVDPEYLCYLLLTLKSETSSQSVGTVFQNLTTDQLKAIPLPIPPLDEQVKIVENIKRVHDLVEGNKKLLDLYYQKSQERISKIWSK